MFHPPLMAWPRDQSMREAQARASASSKPTGPGTSLGKMSSFPGPFGEGGGTPRDGPPAGFDGDGTRSNHEKDPALALSSQP